MKKPDAFPYKHEVSGMVFQIYSAPLSRTDKDGKTTQYESFLVKHHSGGRLAQKRRSNWDDVETYIEDVVAAHRKNDPERLELSGRDRRIYLAAIEALAPLGVDADEAARQYVAATKLVSPHGLSIGQAAETVADTIKRIGMVKWSKVVDFYERHGATMIATKTVPNVVKELLEELRKDKRGDYHLRDMKIRLNLFAASFAGPIHEVLEREITAWLQGRTRTVWKDGKRAPNEQGAPVADRTRNNYRDAINELFAFAKKRGYVPKDLPTEAAGTVRLEVVPGKNHIISPDEAKRVLGSLPPYLVPFTALKLFSGLRTEEAYGLCWEELRFRSNAVIIEAKLAKLRQRRVPPILPNLAKWLKPFPKMKGPLNPGYSSPQAVQNAVIRESKKVGVILRRNTFRNCYISYRVAQPTPSAIVAAETGTSVRMIESNYKELTTKPEAKRWFSILPKRSQMSELGKWAKSRGRAVNETERKRGDEPAESPLQIEP